MKLFRFLILLLLPGTMILTACSDDDDPVTPTIEHPSITISGVLDIRAGAVVPDDARVTVIWSVDAAGDYAYLYGNGSVDTSAGTFTITLEEPPAPALNTSSDGYPSFGVGAIVLGSFSSMEPHKLLPTEAGAVHGGVSNMGVIYMKGNPAEWASHQELNWLSAFTSGYDMGEGMATSGIHDKFVPTPAQSFVLTVSTDPKDFTFPNWK